MEGLTGDLRLEPAPRVTTGADAAGAARPTDGQLGSVAIRLQAAS
jgi:hypothetical protein